MNATHEARRDAIVAQQSDASLLEARRTLDARDALTDEERLAAAWLADELHRRYPETVSIIDGYYEADENLTREYGDLLADALDQLGVFGPAVGAPVRALRAEAAGTVLAPGEVISRDVVNGSPRIVVRFTDGVERAYSGQGIADYVTT